MTNKYIIRIIFEEDMYNHKNSKNLMNNMFINAKRNSDGFRKRQADIY